MPLFGLLLTLIMEVDAATNEPHRVEELWFDDGNIVLQAGTRQFRVFRGILASRSPIFRDMLAVGAQPPDADLIDGCPLVVLPDGAREMTSFLKALHDSSYVRSQIIRIGSC